MDSEEQYRIPDFILGVCKDDICGLNGKDTLYAKLVFGDIIVDSTRTFEDSKIASIYLSKMIGFSTTIECISEITDKLIVFLSDINIPIQKRYGLFFSSGGFHFSGQIVQDLHQFYYDHFPNPIIYKVLSASYLLEYKALKIKERNNIETYLFSITEGENFGNTNDTIWSGTRSGQALFGQDYLTPDLGANTPARWRSLARVHSTPKALAPMV